MDLKDITYKQRRVSHLRGWHLANKMQDVDSVYPGQLHLLGYIVRHPGCTQKEIADWFALSKATITKSVMRMLKNEIVTRKVNKQDERKFQLYATEKGIKVNEKCLAIFGEIDRSMFAGFSDEELAILDGFYQRMMNNLETNYSRDKSMAQLNRESL